MLLDTAVLLWWLEGDARVGPAAQARIAAEGRFSMVSLWEVATLRSLGHPVPPSEVVNRLARTGGLRCMGVEPRHLQSYEALPAPEGGGDPFHRMLVAQALSERVPVMTADRRLARYGVAVVAP